MPIRTGLIAQEVRPHPHFTERFDVWLVGPLPLYTLDPWFASLCEQARKNHKEVKLGTMETRFGEQIVTVAFAEESAA